MTTVSKAEFDALMAKFMTLQQEVETARKRPDPAQFLQSLLRNPIGTLKSSGYGDDHIEHVRQVLIADKLGPQAPMQLQMAAQQGPMMARYDELSATVKQLADMVKQTVTTQTIASEQNKLKAIASDASKNPYLSKAFAKNPEKFINALASQGGTAEEFIAKQEAELKEVAELYGAKIEPGKTAPAASENADTKPNSTEGVVKSANSAHMSDVGVPKEPKSPDGAWGKDKFNGLKARLVAEAETKVKPADAR